jgi:hypothetical protein
MTTTMTWMDPRDHRDMGRNCNFDLGHVLEWRKKNRVSSIVVAFQDSEAFDAGLLADIVELFQ